MTTPVNAALSALTDALGITAQDLAQALVTQGVLVDVKVGEQKVQHVTKDGRTILVTPKQKAHYNALAAQAATNPRPANTFYTDVIVGQRDQRKARKATNAAVAAELDAAAPGWRKLDAVARAQVWEAAKAAHKG